MREILGNKKGIRDSVLNELIALYDVQVPLGQLISAELALKLADITEFINREISLYISRSGQITNIVIMASNLLFFNAEKSTPLNTGLPFG